MTDPLPRKIIVKKRPAYVKAQWEIQLTVELQIYMAAAIDKSLDWNYEGAAAHSSGGQVNNLVDVLWRLHLWKVKIDSSSSGRSPSLLWTSKRRSSKFEARRLLLLSNITVNAGAGWDGTQDTSNRVFPPPTARREATGWCAEMRMEVATYEIPITGWPIDGSRIVSSRKLLDKSWKQNVSSKWNA